jgi:hypothetical protein
MYNAMVICHLGDFSAINLFSPVGVTGFIHLFVAGE